MLPRAVYYCASAAVCVRVWLRRSRLHEFVCLFWGGGSLDNNQITDVGAVKIVEVLPLCTELFLFT